MKKIFTSFILSLSFIAFSLDLNDNANLANRRTALRCLSNATNYVSEKNYDAALNQANLGIAYDDSISDLWYIVATSSYALGKTKAEIISFLNRSLDLSNWVNYNRDNARLMAADILSETGQLNRALELLDSVPPIYSSDAEFIRVKTYYRLADAASISKARNKIDGARKIYPSDLRFPLVFYKYENPKKIDSYTKRLSDFFIQQIEQYQDIDSEQNCELLISAARFTEGEEKKRMLRSFVARGFLHPFYAEEALAVSLIDQQNAFEYICNFAEKELDFDVFKKFLEKIEDEEVIKFISSYMQSFDGMFTQDIDKDGNPNLFVKFVRGRPQKILYDQNQDGVVEWSIDCDFGVPISGVLEEKNMSFTWEKFPYLNTLSFNSSDKKNLANEKFIFLGQSFLWTPILIETKNYISEKINEEFFFPVINSNYHELSNTSLLDAASCFEIEFLNSNEKNNEKISFILLNGNVTQAKYFRDEVLYAQAQFTGNIPVLRVVDFDNDGIFETTEFYSIDEKGIMNVHSLEDERTIMQNLYGIPSSGAEFYLRMIQIDTNKDTIPDFTEEYFENESKITSWDTDSDGNWDVRYVVQSQLSEKKEEFLFYLAQNENLVKVSSVNGIPNKVSCGIEEYFVFSGSSNKVFWLSKDKKDFGEKKYIKLENRIIKNISKNNVQGLSQVIELENECAIFIRIQDKIFAMLINNSEWNKNDKK